MTAKELRYLGREPRRKVNLVNSIIIGVGLPVWAALHSSGDEPGKGRAARDAGGLHRGARQQQPVRARRGRRVARHGGRSHRPDGADRQERGGRRRRAADRRHRGNGVWPRSPAGGPTCPGPSASPSPASARAWPPATSMSVALPAPPPESRSPFAGAGGGQGCCTGLILMVCLIVPRTCCCCRWSGAALVSARPRAGVAARHGAARVGLRSGVVVGRSGAGHRLRRRPPARAARPRQPGPIRLNRRGTLHLRLLDSRPNCTDEHGEGSEGHYLRYRVSEVARYVVVPRRRANGHHGQAARGVAGQGRHRQRRSPRSLSGRCGWPCTPPAPSAAMPA